MPGTTNLARREYAAAFAVSPFAPDRYTFSMDRTSDGERVCAGCGLSMPSRAAVGDHGYYNASPECWSVYTEVLAAEYSHAVIWGQVHQLTVDTYAVQHAGGPHPDKSVDVHLAGLYLAWARGIRGPHIAPMLQRMASRSPEWPHFVPPPFAWPLTVFDVAIVAGDFEEHIRGVRAWSASVWRAWTPHHAAIAAFVEGQLHADLPA